VLLDATSGIPSAWNPSIRGMVYALLLDGSALAVGGGFYGFSGLHQSIVLFREPAQIACTDAASDLRPDSATLNGMVNPQGSDTIVTFQYSHYSGSYTDENIVTSSAGLISGTLDTPVSASVSGLIPGEVYYYRIVASSDTGKVYGEEQSFRTAGEYRAFLPLIVEP
jgi:hypothetical protein